MKKILSIAITLAMLMTLSTSFALPLSAEGIQETASAAVTTAPEESQTPAETTAELPGASDIMQGTADPTPEITGPAFVAAESGSSVETAGLENADGQELIHEYYIEPMYADMEMLANAELYAVSSTEPRQSGTFENIAAAGDYIRNNFVNRVDDFEFTLKTPCTWTDVISEINRHTGNPLFGDSIRWQSYCTAEHNSTGTYYRIYAWYYTTSEQEAALTAKVNSVMSQLNLSGKSDYEKVRAIYDYICKNVVYDNEHLNQSDYTLKYSAYAALINGTSVCQGYALLFYRMCLEAGVDNRIVAGSGNGQAHAWNIVKLNGVYYNCDSTWDAGGGNEHFLKGSSSFEDHIRSADYITEAFNSEYPTSLADYGSSTQVCVVTLDPTEGGKVAQKTFVIEKGKSFAQSSEALPYAARANGIFDGWYDAPVGGAKLESTTAINADKIYYAHWKDSIDNPAGLVLTDFRGRSVSTRSDGIKTVIVMGDINTCLNTKSTMKALSASTHAYRDDVRFIFMQVREMANGKQIFENFAKTNGCGDNFYLCDYSQSGTDGGRLSWQYLRKLYPKMNSYTMPFVMVINESNRCVFGGTHKFMDLDMVYDTLGESTAPPRVIASGYCGENGGTNLIWELDSEGVLTISGSGRMADYSNAPFEAYYESIDKIIIKDGVTSIGERAFSRCRRATSIIIPGSVVSIGKYAFSFCYDLTSIVIPDSVTSIGIYVFQGCSGLTGAAISSGLTSIPGGMFYDCTSLQNVTIPSSVTEIQYYAFANCSSLTNITIPDGVTFINSYAFNGCAGLTRITIPKGVSWMGEAVFGNCPGLTDIYCLAESRPINWGDGWNGSNAKVHWGNAEIPKILPGDVSGDNKLNNQDAIHLLKHVMNSAQYTINQKGDMNGDGKVNNQDAIYLLKHILNPSLYPLKN